jgi:hypothetical protein
MIDDKPALRFRLNGVIIPEIRIKRSMVNGEPVGDLQIAVNDENIGWFTIDDNSWDVNFSSVQNVFAADGKLLDESFIRRIDKFLNELIWMAKTLRYGREQVR